jgi:hypothetical protein
MHRFCYTTYIFNKTYENKNIAYKNKIRMLDTKHENKNITYKNKNIKQLLN